MLRRKKYVSEKFTAATVKQFSEGWDRLKVSFDAKKVMYIP